MKTKVNSSSIEKEIAFAEIINENKNTEKPAKVENSASEVVKKNTDTSNLSTRERLMMMRMNSVTVKSVGSPEDIIPFAWRHPLILSQSKKMSKKYKALTLEESQRASMVPMPTEE